MDKKPWKDIEPPQGAVEAEFLRPVYRGESIGPYRLFEPVEAVIPWDPENGGLLTSERAARRGYSRLSNWLGTAESLWNEHGKGRMTFEKKIDFYCQLSAQFPIRSPRVAYGASGTNPAAATILNESAIIDYRLYWTKAKDEDEARYLLAILNSETARARAEKWQSRGEWGARDFDKVMFNLPIPRFDSQVILHRDLAVCAEHAEKVAVAVPLKEGEYFTRARKRIRDALRANGVADEIDALVERLLSAKSQQIAA